MFGPFSHRAPLYILSSIGGSAVPLTMAWMAELISENAEQRAFTAAAMNTLQCESPPFPPAFLPECLIKNWRLTEADTFSAWIPLVWFQQVHQPNVTPGNRAAAVVAGINVLIFTLITWLAHKEKLQKKRNGGLAPASIASDSSPATEEGNEKRLQIRDEEGISYQK